MNSRRLVITVSVLILLVAIAYRVGYDSRPALPQGTSEGLKITGQVEVKVYRATESGYKLDRVLVTHNLITTAGKSFIATQLGSTTPGANGANYVALTTNGAAPAAGDTTLTSEITDSGLARAQGSFSNVGGSPYTYTIIRTFTASGCTASCTGVQKSGLFTASSGGTMMAEALFSSVNLINGDSLQITWTITLS